MNATPTIAYDYPLKPLWQPVNSILGFWAWVCIITGVVCFPFVLLIFAWPRKVIPAFRKMLAGEPRSYLRLSASGLEYRLWPVWNLRCKWEDVKCIQWDRRWGDVLHLRSVEATGFPEFTINLSPPTIHLSSLAGWPEGELAATLRRYAPQLF